MTISKRNLLLIFFVLILIVFILLFQEGFQNLRLNILSSLRTPLVFISKTTSFLKDLPEFIELKEQNRILMSENEALRLQLLKLKEAAFENQRLKELLDFKKEERSKLLPALVIGRETVSWRASIVVNRGRRDGVKVGSVVLKGEGLVGRVTEVGPTISRVALITDPDSGVSGIIQASRIEGIVTGRSRGGLMMKYLPLDADIKPGERVITSGLGSVFAKGILIGEVIRIKRDPSELFNIAELKPVVDMERLEEVLIIK